MPSSPPNSGALQPVFTQRVLWGTLLFSILVLPVMGRMATQNRVGANPNFDGSSSSIWVMLGLGLALVSFFLPTILRKKALADWRKKNPGVSLDGPLPDAVWKINQLAVILGCALAEATALQGFVLTILSHELWRMLPYVALGLGLMAWHFPRESVVRASLDPKRL